MQKFIKNTLFDIEGLLKKQTGSQHSQQDEVDEVGSQLPEEHEVKVQVVEEVRIVEAKPPAKQITSSSVATDTHTWLGKISKYWTKKDPEDQTASVTQSQGGQSTTLKGWVSPQQTTTSLLDFKSAFTKEEVESMIQSHAKEWRRPWASNNLITQVSNSK